MFSCTVSDNVTRKVGARTVGDLFDTVVRYVTLYASS